MNDGAIESYALVTTEAGPDVSPYHNRQPIMLERNEYSSWMNDAALPQNAVKPTKAGLIKKRPSQGRCFLEMPDQGGTTCQRS
jgi:putative SOS response-associated peptidase YedK